MSTFLGGSEISGMYLGNREISEMYLGSNLFYSSTPGSSSDWPYETLRISKDGGVTWEDYGRPEEVENSQFYRMGITHVEFPETLKSISDWALSENQLETLYIPESVKTIGARAFMKNKLTYVDFPETLDSIGVQAFQDNLLTYVEFPGTLESIGAAAFRNNPNLASARISSQTSYVSTTFPSHTKIITY